MEVLCWQQYLSNKLMQQICVLVRLVMGMSGTLAQASPTSRPGWSQWEPCKATSQGPRLLGRVLPGRNSSSLSWDRTKLKLPQPHRCTSARCCLAASPSLPSKYLWPSRATELCHPCAAGPWHPWQQGQLSRSLLRAERYFTSVWSLQWGKEHFNFSLKVYCVLVTFLYIHLFIY